VNDARTDEGAPNSVLTAFSYTCPQTWSPQILLTLVLFIFALITDFGGLDPVSTTETPTLAFRLIQSILKGRDTELFLLSLTVVTRLIVTVEAFVGVGVRLGDYVPRLDPTVSADRRLLHFLSSRKFSE